jgi:hypothetical protein
MDRPEQAVKGPFGDGKPGVRAPLEGFLIRLPIGLYIEPDNLAARLHQLDCPPVSKSKHSFEHLLLCLFKCPVLRALGDQNLDLVLGDGRFAARPYRQDPHDDAG